MELVLATGIFGLAMAGMAVGVIFQGRRLKGSCGGTQGACTCSALAARACPIRRQRQALAASAREGRPTDPARGPE